MPSLLRKDSIRLLEGSREALYLAVVGLGVPRLHVLREEAARYSPEIGLLGAAAELAMSACLVETYGRDTLLLGSNQFKSASEILEDFRYLLKHPVPRANFTVQGLAESAQHREMLHEQTRRFKVLLRARAGGLHAGLGPSRDVMLQMAQYVFEFLNALSKSSRIRPYLEPLPLPPQPVKDQATLLDDLAHQVREASTTSEQAAGLRSIFLVLPEVPQEEPDWLSALDRVSIAPREVDIVYLLQLLGQARPALLLRGSGEGAALRVRYSPSDPRALPIAPQFLRREFNQMAEQFYADVGTANGRLKQGVLDVPPIDVLQDLFVVGIDKAAIRSDGDQLIAQQVWPFVVASLSSNGVPGPYWFLVRETRNVGQLPAILDQAASLGSTRLKNRLSEAKMGIEAIRRNASIPPGSALAKEMAAAMELAGNRREGLGECLDRSRGTVRQADEALEKSVLAIMSGEDPVGPVLEGVADGAYGLSSEARKYWARSLAEAATEETDLPGLLSALRTEDITPAHTAVRKALRLIDFSFFGPPMDHEG